MHTTAHGRALTPEQRRHSLYLDALAAFGLASGLSMEADPTPDPPPAPAPAPTPDPVEDKGFPEGTPLEEMTAEQQAAYWKDKARKHETRVKSLGNLSADELAALREKANRHDALEFELMSDKEKAVVEAREAAASKAREEFAPRLVRAEFKAAAANRIDAAALASILEPLDLTKFLDGDDVDEAKVAAYVDAVAPAKADDSDGERRRGPSPVGAGRRSSSTGPSLQTGAELYQSRKRRG